MLSRSVRILFGTLGTLVIVVSTIIQIQRRRKQCKERKEEAKFSKSSHICSREGGPALCVTQRNETGEMDGQNMQYRTFDNEATTETSSNIVEGTYNNTSMTISTLPSGARTGEGMEAIVASNLARTRCARCGQFGHKCSDCEKPVVPIGRDWGRTCRRMAFILRRKEGFPIECEKGAGRGHDEEMEDDS